MIIPISIRITAATFFFPCESTLTGCTVFAVCVFGFVCLVVDLVDVLFDVVLFAEVDFLFRPATSAAETVVFFYLLLYTAFFGFLTNPVPFMPYIGLTAFFAARVNFPVVLAFKDLVGLGVRIPNFILFPL